MNRHYVLILTIFFLHCSYSNLFAQWIKVWDYRYGGTDEDFLTQIMETKDHGFLLAGYSESDSTGNKTQNARGSSDYWIVKTDSSGIKQWDKRYGGTGIDWLYFVIKTLDGGYLLCGTSQSVHGG